MPILLHSEFVLGDMLVRYQAPANDPLALGLSMLPQALAQTAQPPREHLDGSAILHLPARWQPVTAWEVDPLVHVHLQHDIHPGAFAQGRTLHRAPATHRFRLQEQTRVKSADITCIRTTLASIDGLIAVHELSHRHGESALRVRTTIRNEGVRTVSLELLTSFSLGGITPFVSNDAPGRLWIHRFRSAWSAEGRPEARSVEELHLERSWIGHGVRSERFGQVGSLPTNGFFPFCAIEDRGAGVFWGANLAHPGSWQMEIGRRADQLTLSGGLADREFGHWVKRLAPGEAITSPEARLTVTAAGFEDLCDRLLPSASAAPTQPAAESDLPIVFNEWCTSWGAPTHDNLIALADRLRGSGVRYLVIDDGWAERTGDGIQQNGDWIVNRSAFPHGLRVTAGAIRERGLIPGIWFEFEVVNPGSKAWEETSHQLHRDGVPLQVGTRRFWDFRDPWVHDYLEIRVIDFLRENGFGYLKIDYNDTIGLGCDGAESLGEGLRQHLEGVQRFLRRLREQLPELVIENCSSGGHRAEPSMMALSAMTSFSDAHETPDVPIIAANLNKLIAPRQSQIWAVLRPDDALQRLSYSLAATFLGRMCLSGDAHALSPEAWQFTQEAIALYQKLAPQIATGRFRRHGQTGSSYQHLTGWQAVVVDQEADKDASIFVVWHTFADAPTALSVPLPPKRAWRFQRDFSDRPSNATVEDLQLVITSPRPWSGGVFVLQ